MEDIRKIVQECIQEVFWTEKDWDDYLGKTTSINDSSQKELKEKIKQYIESNDFRLRDSVLRVMDFAKKINPNQNEYDLIDVVKSILLDLEKEDDHMDDFFRKRFVKVYEEFDYMFEKINEIVSAASISNTDNQMEDPGVSAVSTKPTDDEDINEDKNKEKKKKQHPYVMTLPSGLVYSFDVVSQS